MIVLLTGKPGIGKSTALQAFIEHLDEPANWVVTSGIPRPEGGRAGFKARNSAGEERIISHKTGIDSPLLVGENRVDLAAVDRMFSSALDSALDGQLTIIDEIGPMQLFSEGFSAALKKVFTRPVDLVATIHYQDQRLEQYRQSPAAILLAVSLVNRDNLPKMLQDMVTHRRVFNGLDAAAKNSAVALLQQYVAHSQPMQVHKLMSNALYYVQEKRVLPADGDWTVRGRHGEYRVRTQDDRQTCECDLFNGRGEYKGQAGECSHIQAVLIAMGVGYGSTADDLH